MGTLGCYFPDEDRHDFAARHLKPGQILYLDCDFTVPPKKKYVVLAAVPEEPGPLLFCINSEINDYVSQRNDLLTCQVPLTVAQHEFLDHDSYIDCSKVIEELGHEELNDQLVNDPAKVKGELDPQTIADVIQAVQRARTISAYHKRLIVGSLQ